MRAGTQIPLRRVIMFAWLVMVLTIVAPALAQDGGEATPLGERGGDTPQVAPQTPDTDPSNLTEVAVELAPLLLGAALIERLLEYLFTLAEASLLRTGTVARSFLQWINGTLMVDARGVYAEYERIRKALLAYHAGLVNENMPKNPDSPNPDDWPFEKVLEQFELYGAKVAQLEEWLNTTTRSAAYINRRKTVAMVGGIIMGLALASVADIRLFQPIEFGSNGNWFDIIDLLAAGVLMGLGTDYVHQIVSVVTKGQRYLGAVSGRQPSETVKIDIGGFKADVDTQLHDATAGLDQRFAALEDALRNLGVDVEDPPST